MPKSCLPSIFSLFYCELSSLILDCDNSLWIDHVMDSNHTTSNHLYLANN